MINYYEILSLNNDCSKQDIKKQYHFLSKKYHPDKNININDNGEYFKKIKESYDVLYNEDSRKRYDIKLIFKDIDFTEQEYELFFSYYNSFINSKEYRLMKKLYETIPEKTKNEVKEKFYDYYYNKKNKKIVLKEKSIDINELNENMTVVLYVSCEDNNSKKLKIIHIYSKYGIYYLYLREFKNKIIHLDNKNCFLTLKIYVKGDLL